MEILSNKAIGSSLPAIEWNQVPNEIENVITELGQTLVNTDLNQLGKGIAGYVANGNFYTDSGIANAYVLTQIGTKQAPTSYTDGMKVIFRVGNLNTGISTVNVATLGVKNIFFASVALIGGEIISGSLATLIYDSANNRFDLIPQLNNVYTDSTGLVLRETIRPSLKFKRLNSNSATGNIDWLGANDLVGWRIGVNDTQASTFSIKSGPLNTNAVITLTTGKRMGINENLPDGTLHVTTVISGAPFSTLADDFILENSLDCGITIASGINSKGNIYYASITGGTASGQFSYDHSIKQFDWFTTSLKKMSLGLGLVLGTPTGGDKGNGSGNFQSLFINNVPVASGGTLIFKGAFATPSMAQNTTFSVAVTHGLGTDDVHALVSVISVTNNIEQTEIGYKRPDGQAFKGFGIDAISLGVTTTPFVPTPATGDIQIFIVHRAVLAQINNLSYIIIG